MAVDIKILKLLGDQEKSQKKSNRVLESINESVRYNISQSNSLKSGLGEVTSKLIKEVKTGKGDSQIDSSKSPTVRKLDEIKLILQSQRDLLDKAINSQFESDPTAIADLDAKDKEDKDKDEDEDKDKETSLVDRLFKFLSVPALMAAGAALAAAVSPFLEPFTRLYDTIKALPELAGKAINGAKAAWNAIKSTSSSIFNKINEKFPKIANAVRKFKNATAKTGNAIKNFGNKIKGAASKIGNFIKNLGGKVLEVGKSLISKAKNLGGKALKTGKDIINKGKDLASKTADAAKKLASKTGNIAKGVASRAGTVAKAIPGMKSALAVFKGAGAIVKRLPLLSAGMEAAEAAKIAAMSPSERKEYLRGIVKEMEGKSMLGKAWYAFNNNTKAIAAAGQEVADLQEAQANAASGEERIKEMEAILERKKAARAEKEKLNAEPIVDQNLRDQRLNENIKQQMDERHKNANYPPPPNNTTINQTTVTAPGSDYGNTIRRGNR
tara:strand:+ start:37 stop:1527 length:1491 start_codon:yes stop_codon:yes gene_type:complete